MGKTRFNLPYEKITATKWDSLGSTMKLSKALNMGWNSVRFTINGHGWLCYRCCDGTYDLLKAGRGPDLLEFFRITEKQALSLDITVDDDYFEDSDGYPCVFATVELTDHNKKILGPNFTN